MAAVIVTVEYEIEVPELDEAKNYEEVLGEVRDDWSYFIDRNGYTATCTDVQEF